MQMKAGSPDREPNVECHSDTAVRMTTLYRPRDRFVASAVFHKSNQLQLLLHIIPD